MKRYQMVLIPCEATAKSSWGKSIHSGNTILELWEDAGWRGNTNHDQEIEIQDTKLNKKMTEEEYATLVNKLKKW